MRIGLFSDTYLPDINGVATSVETLRQVLEEHGHDVFVIANHKGLLHLKREGNILRLPGIELKWLYGYSMSSPIQIRAKDEVKAMNLDLIHVHTEFGVGIFGRQLAKELNVPLISTYHTMYEDYTHYINLIDSELIEKASKLVVESFSKISTNHSQIVIAPSSKTKNTLVSYGITAPVYIIPTGINLNNFKKENIDELLIQEIKDTYQIKKDDRVIVYVGRIAEEKSIDKMIKGFRNCALADERYKLMIVGGGPDLDKLKELTKNLGIEKNVIFTGKQNREKVPAFYRCGEAFASFSTSETQGMTYIEALACSLPIFVQKDDVLLDLVDERENGYYVDEDTFSDRLMEFFKLSDEKHHDMEQKARNKALRYDLDIFYDHIISCYNEALTSYYKRYKIVKINMESDHALITFKKELNEEIKCLVSLDDYFAFKLIKDNTISELTLLELQKREVVLKAYNLCLKKIALKDRTRKEMYDILLKDGSLNTKQMNEMIEKLEKNGYIDDQAYLINQVEKMKDSFDGKQKMIRQLVKKGLPYEMVEQAFESYDDENEKNKAFMLLEKLERSISGGSVIMKKQKLISKLINKGFSFDIAKDVVNHYEFTDEFLNEKDTLTKDIQKMIKTYSNKYVKDELKQKVCNQLVKKGYYREDILNEIERMGIFDDED
ncbi:MAG: glycosyltransferase [Traorella sp.]